jgi:thiamine biosynthesis lipoprotein
MNRRKFIWASLGLGALAAAGGLRAGWPRKLERHALEGRAFGATVSLVALDADPARANAALAEALAEVMAVDALMSLYRDDSQLTILNRSGRLAKPDPRVLEVLRQAQKTSIATGGAFDVTVQPLWTLFSDAKDRGALPTDEAREQARALVDWRDLEVADDEVRLRRPGMGVTLNGIAQGYAADRALMALRRHGVEHALLLAGAYVSLGRNERGESWTLGVQHPRNPEAIAAKLALDGRALSTSGDYETFFTPDFLHHHIFDPATGDSPTELASASVLTPTGMMADSLSTSFMVLGAERALKLAATLPGVDALLIGKDGRRWRTPGLPALDT